MKQGRYFRIPESPGDVDRLWSEAPRARQLPAWLAPAGLDAYRRVTAASPPQHNEDERCRYFEELQQLEAASLVIDDVEDAGPGHVIYVPAPPLDEPWAIGIYGGNSPLRLDACVEGMNPVLTRDSITDATASFVADPFMIHNGGRWFMFFEVMNWKTNKGEIGLATSDDGLRWRYDSLVLVEPFHLSYPFVFEWEGTFYMIPESGQAADVRLYRARRFPFDWELAGLILGGSYADSSLLRFDGRWWLFTTPMPGNDTLRLFHALDLEGPWIEHRASPVIKGNPSLARSAGRPLVHNGAIIRYAQDCEHEYGKQVRAVRILELTTDRYEEDSVGASTLLAPGRSGWNSSGMHHVDAHIAANDRWLACVDARAPAVAAANERP